MRTLFLSKVNEDLGLGFSDGIAICINLRASSHDPGRFG